MPHRVEETASFYTGNLMSNPKGASNDKSTHNGKAQIFVSSDKIECHEIVRGDAVTRLSTCV